MPRHTKAGITSDEMDTSGSTSNAKWEGHIKVVREGNTLWLLLA